VALPVLLARDLPVERDELGDLGQNQLAFLLVSFAGEGNGVAAVVSQVETMEIPEAYFYADRGFPFDIDVENLGFVEVVGESESTLDGDGPIVEFGPAFKGFFCVGLEVTAIEPGEGPLSVGKGFCIHSEHLEQAEVEAAEFLIFVVAEVATGLEKSAPLSGEDDGDAGGGVVVAVPHAGAVEDDTVIQQCAMLILVRLHPIEQIIEFLHVPEADLEEAVEVASAEVAEEVGKVVVLLVDAEEIKDHAAVGVAEHVGDAAGGIGPEGKGDQVDHCLHLLIQIGRVVGASDFGEVEFAVSGWGALEIFEALFGFPDDSQVLVEGVAVFGSGFAGEELGFGGDAVEQAGHLFPLGRVAHRVAEEAVKDEDGVTFTRQEFTIGAVGYVATADLPRKETFGGQFEGAVLGVPLNFFCNELVGGGGLGVPVVTTEEAAGRVGMGGEAEVPEVVEDEEVVLVLGKGLHEGRHPEFVFRAAADVPGGRMYSIGFEQGHETHRRSLLLFGGTFHHVEEGEGEQSTGTSEERAAGDAERFGVGVHSVQKLGVREDGLLEG